MVLNIVDQYLLDPHKKRRQWGSMCGGGALGYPLGSVLSKLPLLLPLENIVFYAVCMGSSGLGWMVANRYWTPMHCLDQIITRPDFWRILHEKLPNLDDLIETHRTTSTPDSNEEGSLWTSLQSYITGKNPEPFKPSYENKIYTISDVNDPSSILGRLYQIIVVFVLERYNIYRSSPKYSIYREYQHTVQLLQIKAPSLTRCELEIQLYKDLYPYIYSYYILENAVKPISPGEVCVYSSDDETVLTPYTQWSDAFRRHIVSSLNMVQRYTYPQEKAAILEMIILDIEKDSDNPISCDDLIPVLRYILQQPDIPQLLHADIFLVYDYYLDRIDKTGYITTLWKSALCANNFSSQING